MTFLLKQYHNVLNKGGQRVSGYRLAGTVRAVTSDTRGPQFDSSLRQNLLISTESEITQLLR